MTWPKIREFATQAQRYEKRPEVWGLLQPIFAEQPSSHWLEVLEDAGVPAGPVYKVDEMFADPQVRAISASRSRCTIPPAVRSRS